MPTMTNFSSFLIINLAFLFQIIIMIYFRSALDIKENWPLYRCNPPYWFFSDNIAQDFTYCVQNSQLSIMGNLLQPVTYLISNLTSVSSEFSESINNARYMISNIREYTGSIFQNIFGVFFNLIIELQKMVLSIKDMVGKIIGVNAVILFVLDGSVKTLKSVWSGPPGKMVQAIGSCFHPDTKIKTKNGDIYKMKDIPLGAELEDGSKVFSVLKIDNPKKIPLYKIDKGINGEPIFVTGEHFIFDKNNNKFIQVKDSTISKIQDTMIINEFSCLITTNRRIQIAQHIFWDWEDDELM
jgi:hypothetical protein